MIFSSTVSFLILIKIFFFSVSFFLVSCLFSRFRFVFFASRRFLFAPPGFAAARLPGRRNVGGTLIKSEYKTIPCCIYTYFLPYFKAYKHIRFFWRLGFVSRNRVRVVTGSTCSASRGPYRGVEPHND